MLFLVVIDISILGLYKLVDGVRGQLEAKQIVNRENPEDMIGVSEFLRNKFVYVNNKKMEPDF